MVERVQQRRELLLLAVGCGRVHRVLHQVCHRHVEQLRHLADLAGRDVLHAPGLPLADGVFLHAEPFAQLRLRQLQLLAVLSDLLSDGHGKNLPILVVSTILYLAKPF